MNDLNEQKVLLLFCEGEHDAAFIHLILEEKMGGEEHKMARGEYPQPFPGLFSNAQNRIFKGESKTTDEIFPQATYKYKDWLIIIFKMEGHEFKPNLQKSLKMFFEIKKSGIATGTIDDDNCTKISTLRYAFVFDADELGFAGRCQKWLTDFGQISNCSEWKIAKKTEGSDYWQRHDDKGIFVWHGQESNQQGTLEDITISILEKFDGFPVKSSIDFCNKQDKWIWPAASNEKDRIAQEAKKKKMAMTIAGQFHRSGKALGPIIQDSLKELQKKKNDQTKVQVFVNNSIVCEFDTFLKKLLQ